VIEAGVSDAAFRLKARPVARAGAQVKKLKDEIIAAVKSLRLNQQRIDALVEQLYDINKPLVGLRGSDVPPFRELMAWRATTS
jgi:hypothetical protein